MEKKKRFLADEDVFEFRFSKDKDHSTQVDDKVLLSYMWSDSPRKYTSRYNSVFRINGQIINDATLINEFMFSMLENKETFIDFQIDILKSKIDGFELVGEFAPLIKRMMALKDNLIIRTNNKGEIEKVLNKLELENKWKNFREELPTLPEFQKIPEGDREKLIQQGNKEYLTDYDMVSDLKKGSFYAILFNSLYDTFYTISRKNLLNGGLKDSNIFQDIRVPLQLFLEIEEISKEKDFVLYTVKGNIDHSKFDDREIKELFRQNYPFIKEPFKHYTYEYFCLYEVSLSNGLINSAKMGVYEAINNAIEVDVECEIDQITDIEEE